MTDISAAATELATALVTLRSQSQALSSDLQTVQIRQDFTKAMINTLQSGADGLTLADSNEEGANLLALQTRQQLSTTALSLASQADQNVLQAVPINAAGLSAQGFLRGTGDGRGTRGAKSDGPESRTQAGRTFHRRRIA